MTAELPLPDPPHKQFKWLVELLMRRYRHSSAECRITVVLGAGGSLSSGLSKWDREFKTELIDAACAELNGFVEECWRQLKGTIGLGPTDVRKRREALIEIAEIEDIAAVALNSAIVGDRVYDLLKSKFTPADAKTGEGLQPPQLGYELLAHFLKHAFIDHILTFNFDELLDEAIENELGRGEVTHVACEQDLSPSITTEGPHLIKLHGTLSRPATLRFTRAMTSALSPAMIQLLDRVVLGGAGVDQQGAMAVANNYIISLGYGWRDPDVKHWLDARKDLVKGLLIVGKGPEDTARLRRDFESMVKSGRVRVLNTEELCDVAPDQLTVDTLLWALWSELEARMTAEQVPFMPASRHILLSYLFRPQGLQRPAVHRVNEHEALRRFVVEFVLHLAKCKGMVNLSTMASDDRIGRYYSFVKKRHSDAAKRAHMDLLSLVTSTGFINQYQFGKGTPERTKNLTVRPSEYPDVKETYYAVAADPKDLALPLQTHNAFALGPIDRPRYRQNQKKIIQGEGGVGADFVEKQIVAIFNGPEIEVGRRPSDRESWTLKSATPITTYIDLQTKTTQMLETDWTDLLLIAESGAWLKSKTVEATICNGTPRRIFLIEARQPSKNEWKLRNKISEDLKQTWRRYARQDVIVRRLSLSWWEHNRHMTLAFGNDGGGTSCLGGISFRRRHKKSRIQPLFIDPTDSEDVAELVLTFLAYLRRAFEERAGPSPEDDRAVTEYLARCCEIAEQIEQPPSVRSRLAHMVDRLHEVARTISQS